MSIEISISTPDSTFNYSGPASRLLEQIRLGRVASGDAGEAANIVEELVTTLPEEHLKSQEKLRFNRSNDGNDGFGTIEIRVSTICRVVVLGLIAYLVWRKRT
ncbi:hypothetical protein F5Y02DRAFT_421254 [Annulohypoxylon stygium]|nr:hypothetical protein F5Y02DRAFT_421254 [Annulohypoxylon stygium]